MSDVHIVIPARYASSRLPAKPLKMLAGKTMIQHTYERALEAGLGEIVIATDDQRIVDVCQKFNAPVCLTSTEHQSGSDRLAEVVQKFAWHDDTIVVNLQGDEPLTPISCLQQVAQNLQSYQEASIATLATPILCNKEYQNSNIVKVVRDYQGYALYFSRAMIPFQRDALEDTAQTVQQFALRHIGIYAYRASFLKVFSRLPICPIETLEKLEQLRALWNGKRIHVDLANDIPAHGVDTYEDLRAVEQYLQK
jgi:3-deoxy-manno-octulosonate cytidylyltransferase (CMP-KDO synthetase)